MKITQAIERNPIGRFCDWRDLQPGWLGVEKTSNDRHYWYYMRDGNDVIYIPGKDQDCGLYPAGMAVRWTNPVANIKVTVIRCGVEIPHITRVTNGSN